MKFLSALSRIFQVGLQIFTGFAPVLNTALPKTGEYTQTISQDLTEIANVITDVEQVAVALQLKGPDKLKAAAPLVAEIILKSTLLANHKIANPDLFNQGVNEVAGGIADILNSLSTDGLNNMVVKKS